MARSSDDETIVVAYVPVHAAPHQVVGEQHAHLVAAQHAASRRRRRPGPRPRSGRRRGRWRWRCRRRSPAASASSQVHRARLLRVGERHGREVPGPARPARRPRRAAAKPARGERRGRAPRRRPRAAACTPPPGPRGPSGSTTAAAAVHVGRRRCRRRAPRPGSPSGTSASGPTARIAASISGVGRRHDLRARAERAAELRAQVDLVAVVLRRVVAGGHHHPGHRARCAHRVREHRRGQRPGQQQRARARRRWRPGRSRSANVAGAVPGVVPDDQRAGPALRRRARRPARRRPGVTTARFIPFGPARSGPRRPAVPKVSGPANRSASSGALAGSRVEQLPAARPALAGSGSSASQRSASSRSRQGQWCPPPCLLIARRRIATAVAPRLSRPGELERLDHLVEDRLARRRTAPRSAVR